MKQLEAKGFISKNTKESVTEENKTFIENINID
jgi:ribosomal protein S19E (S16A)